MFLQCWYWNSFVEFGIYSWCVKIMFVSQICSTFIFVEKRHQMFYWCLSLWIDYTSAIVFISWDKDNKFHQSVKEVMGKAKPTHQNQRTNNFLGEFIGSGSHAILCTIHTDQKKKE